MLGFHFQLNFRHPENYEHIVWYLASRWFADRIQGDIDQNWYRRTIEYHLGNPKHIKELFSASASAPANMSGVPNTQGGLESP